jgi:hypothetical protein
MKTLRHILLFALFATLFAGCKTTSTGPIISTPSPSIDQDIIGSWEGCDGRVITFAKEGNEIIGRYIKLGGLERYKFTLNEEGYRLTWQSAGNYTGTVKWQNPSGNETWKKVSITINNNAYKDSTSDPCSKEMKRVEL